MVKWDLRIPVIAGMILVVETEYELVN
jgi:hypothetical protein